MCLGLGGAADQAQVVAQPLHGGAGDGDGALERVRALPGPAQAAVESSPKRLDGTGCSPTCSSRNDPVPYVFFASPGAKQAWPSRAAC